ncbi:MAG: TonB family protein [Sulfuricella sp.]
MAPNPSYAGAAAAEKLALTLAGSMLFHFALIFGLQIRAAPAAAPSTHIIQARLVEVPRPITAPQTAPQQPEEPEPTPDTPSLQDVEPVPPPQPELAATEPPAPEPPASTAVPEKNVNLPSIEVPLLEDPTYYPAQEVDVHPTALHVIQPVYPTEAANTNMAGSVTLVLLLDESGKVQDITVEESSPPGIFDRSALEAFRNARFTPAQRHGRAVKSRVRIKVTYELADDKTAVDKAKQK